MKKEGKRKNREDGWPNGRIGPKKRSRDGGKAEICCPRWQRDGLVPLRLLTTIAAAEDVLVGFSEVQLFKPIYSALFIT